MDKKYICRMCGYVFGTNALINAYLKERTVILECPSCHEENIIRENASCDCNYGQIGPGCRKIPVFLIPYKTQKGLDFKCACKYHFRYVDIPYSGFIPETHEAIGRAWEKSHPALYSSLKAIFIFLAFGWLMFLYSMAGSQFRFFAMTMFSFFWMVFCLSWVVGYKVGFIRLTKKLYDTLLMIWIVILFMIIILEISIHILW